MTWVKLDDCFDENLKVRGLSDSGFRLYVTLLCYCARKETDGRFSSGIAKSFGSPRAVKELVGAGLWIQTDAGLEVKDFLTYNPSHAQLEAERARVRGRVGGHRARKSNTGSNGVTPGGGNAGGTNGDDTGGNTMGNGGGTAVPGSRINHQDLSDSGDPDLSAPSQPKDLKASAREDRFAASFVGPDDELPDSWAPTPEHAELARGFGLDLGDEVGIYRARRKRDRYVCGNWDADFEIWLRQGKKLARERQERRGGGTATRGGPSEEWPTDVDLSLREAIRGGAHGPKLKTKLEAGQLDAALARRLVREREAEIRDRKRSSSRPPPGLSGDVPGGSLAALAAGIGRTIT